MKTEKRVLKFGSRRIPYQLTVAQRKRLRIVVRPDLTVKVEAPRGCSDKEISQALRSKASWLARQLDELESFHPLPRPYRYVSGETLVYLGRQYRLRIIKGDPSPAKLKGRYLRVSTPDKTDKNAVRSTVESWYREHAEQAFARSLERCLAIAQRHRAKRPTLAIRKMQTRWGSCSAKGRMTLNLYLVQMPVHHIDYVVMHELCHTVEHNHSVAFYRLLTRCMPDWKQRREGLNKLLVSRF